MSKPLKYIIVLVLTAALGLGSFAAFGGAYDGYKLTFGEARWHTKYNNFVDAASSLGSLIANWVGTVDSLTLIQTTPTYSNASTFTLAGDYSALLTPGKRLVADCVADGLKPNTVVSCTYAAPNSTVVVTTANLTNNLAAVSYYATRNGINTYGSGDIVASEFGAPSWANLQAAVNLANSTGRRLLLTPGTWPVSDGLSLSAPWQPVPGAVLEIATTKTLTLSGPGPLNTGNHQVFSCQGTGAVAGLKTVNPYWFYSGTGSWHTAVQQAINALPNNYFPEPAGVLTFPAGQSYSFDAGVTIPYTKRVAIVGEGEAYSAKLLMSAAFNPANTLISYTGASGQRPSTVSVKGVTIQGNNDEAVDGIGISAAYSNDAHIDVWLTGIRNHGLYFTYPWDLRLRVRSYGCGWNDGATDKAAVYVGSPVSAGADNMNGVQILPGTRIERSFGTTLELNTGANVQVFGKIHGRAYSDANSGNVGSLIKINNVTSVNLIACEIDQFRYLFVANGITPTTELGAVNITGTSIVTLNGCTLLNVGDETGAGYATWAVNFNPTDGNSKLVMTGNQFREPIGSAARANCPYIKMGAGAGAEAILSAGNKYKTPAMAFAPLSTVSGGQCYVLPVVGLPTNLADSTTYQFGVGGTTMATSTAQSIRIPKSGFVKHVQLSWGCAAGTNEDVAVYLRKNNTTDYTLSTALKLDAVTRVTLVDVPKDTATGLEACYVDRATDYLQIKVVTSAFATNPTAVTCYGFITVQEP